MRVSVQHAGIWILRAQTKGAALALTRLKHGEPVKVTVRVNGRRVRKTWKADGLIVTEVVLEGHRELEEWVPALVKLGCHFVRSKDSAPIEYDGDTFVLKEEPLVTVAKRAMGRR